MKKVFAWIFFIAICVAAIIITFMNPAITIIYVVGYLTTRKIAKS